MSTPFPYWQPNTAYPPSSYIFDGTGNIQHTTAGGTSGATAPAWTTSVTSDGSITWTFFGFGGRAIEFQVLDPQAPGLVQQSNDATSYSRGVPDAGKYVLLSPTGQLDPSMGGGGGGGGGSSFGSITTGTNISADMIVGSSPSGSAILQYDVPLGGGVINANEIGGINVAFNVPTHAGEVLISQPGNTSAAWADPQVQGLYDAGSQISPAPAYVAPTNIQPIMMGGSDYGAPARLRSIKVDSSGNIYIGGGTVSVSGTVGVTQSTAPWVVSGTVTANQGTSPWVVSLASTTITGTVAVTQGTSPWVNRDVAAENSLATLASTVGQGGSPAEPVINVNVVNQTGTTIAPIASEGNAPGLVPVATSSSLVLAANALRKGCVITNMSPDTISLAFAPNAAQVYYGLVLGPGGNFSMGIQDFTTAAINAIADGPNGYVAVEEFQ